MACGLKFLILVPYSGYNRHATYVACGLKLVVREFMVSVQRSCHVCGMWIEIEMSVCIGYNTSCHATYVACGLKYHAA